MTYTLTVWLCPWTFGLPGPAQQAIRFDVDATSEHAACEIAFAVCNSYATDEQPSRDELHCDYSYRDVVVEYRDRKHRSLSVGDYVQVGHTWYRCDITGFSRKGPPHA